MILAKLTGTSIYYFHQDHLGSTRLVTLGTSTTYSTNYQPFGPQYGASGTDPGYKYTGKLSSSAIGLSYYGARWYDPSIGRFISQDPASGGLSDPQSFNTHAYVRNNPLKYVDPTGEFWFLGVAVAAVVGFAVGYVGCGLATGGWAKGECFAAGAAVAVAAAVIVATFGLASAAIGGAGLGAGGAGAAGFTGFLGLSSYASGTFLSLGAMSLGAGLFAGSATFTGGMRLLDLFSSARAPGGVNPIDPGVSGSGSKSGGVQGSLTGMGGQPDKNPAYNPKNFPGGENNPKKDPRSLAGYGKEPQKGISSRVKTAACGVSLLGGYLVGEYARVESAKSDYKYPAAGVLTGGLLCLGILQKGR